VPRLAAYTTPEPLRMILGGVSNRVDRFGAGLFPRQWQHRLHGRDGRLMRFLIADTVASLRTIG
jgi:hypothetical protein